MRHGRDAVIADGLGKRFGAKQALQGFDLAVPEGTVCGLLGPNGAGKTTAVRVLATLLRPHSGRARVLGGDLPADAWRVRGRVGYLGHEPLLYRDLTARENLRFHARLHDVAFARVDELLEAVGMARRADEPVHALSRGMAQRVAICRALLHEPELLLLDEPRSHLDAGAAAVVDELLDPAPGRARVIVTHEVEATLAEADTVLLLRGDGSVGHAGPAAAVSPGDVRSVYSGQVCDEVL